MSEMERLRRYSSIMEDLKTEIVVSGIRDGGTICLYLRGVGLLGKESRDIFPSKELYAKYLLLT